MGDASRTITIKFTGNTKNLIASVAEANTALKSVGKSNPELDKLSKSLEKVGSATENVAKKSSLLKSFKDAIRSFSDGVQPLGDMGLRLATITTAVVALAKVGPYLAPLIGTIGLVPGAALAAAGAVAVLKLGSDGLSKAFKGVADNAKNQVSAVFQKEMAPAAKNLKGLLDDLVPSLKKVASEESSVASSLAQTAHSSENVKSLNTILGATRDVVHNVGAALAPLLTALLTIGSVAAPMFADLTSSAGHWAEKLNDKVQQVAQNGKLQEWIQKGIDRFNDLEAGVVRVWKDIQPILKGLAGSKLTLFAGVGSSLIEPALKAIGDFMAAHPDFAQWIVVGGLALKGFAVAMTLVNAAMDINPIILAIEAIALIAVGLVALYQNNAGFKQWVDATWKGIEDVTGRFVGWWQQNVSPILAKGWELVEIAAQSTYEYFRDTIVPGLKQLWSDISPTLQAAWQNLVDAWNEFKPTLTELYNFIKAHWSEIKQAAKDYGEAVGVVIAAVVVVLGLLAIAVAGAFKFISDQIRFAVEVFNDLKSTVQGFLEFFGLFTLQIGLEAQQIGSGIRRFLTDPWGAIQDAARGALQWVKDAWSGLPSWFRDLASQIAGPFVSAFNAIVGGVRGAINSAIDLANRGIGAVNGVTGAIGIPSIPTIPHLAMGGPVQAGRPYIVGDGGGPELFVPRQSGRVVGTQDTADLMNGGDMSGDVVLTIDGEVIARIAKRELLTANRTLRAAVRAGSTR